MNTPYHCGFFLKIWDQMFGALYPTKVLIMLQAHIQLCSCIYMIQTEWYSNHGKYLHTQSYGGLQKGMPQNTNSAFFEHCSKSLWRSLSNNMDPRDASASKNERSLNTNPIRKWKEWWGCNFLLIPSVSDTQGPDRLLQPKFVFVKRRKRSIGFLSDSLVNKPSNY